MSFNFGDVPNTESQWLEMSLDFGNAWFGLTWMSFNLIEILILELKWLNVILFLLKCQFKSRDFHYFRLFVIPFLKMRIWLEINFSNPCLVVATYWIECCMNLFDIPNLVLWRHLLSNSILFLWFSSWNYLYIERTTSRR